MMRRMMKAALVMAAGLVLAVPGAQAAKRMCDGPAASCAGYAKTGSKHVSYKSKKAKYASKKTLQRRFGRRLFGCCLVVRRQVPWP